MRVLGRFVVLVGLALAAPAGAGAQLARVAHPRMRAPGGDGQYTVVVAHPQSPDIVLVGTTVGAVMRTDDGGLTWDRIALVPSEAPPLSMGAPSVELELPEPEDGDDDDGDDDDDAPDPAEALLHPDTEGYVIGDLTFCDSAPDTAFAASRAGMFRSRDAGATWEPLGTLEEIEGSLFLECDETTPGHVVVATDDGVMETLDDGETWRVVRVFADVPVSYVYPDGPGRLVAASSLGVYSGEPPADLETVVYDGRPIGDDSGDVQHFALTDGPTAYVGMTDGAVVTHDGGSHWSRVAETEIGRLVVALILVDPRDERHAYFLAREPPPSTGGGAFDTSPGWIFETRDAGETVEAIPASASARELRGMSLDPTNPEHIWLLTSTALYSLEPQRPTSTSSSSPLAIRAALALRRDPGLQTVLEVALRRARLRAEDESALRRDLARSAWAPVVSLGVRVDLDSPERRMGGLGPLRWEPEFRLHGDPRVVQLLPPNEFNLYSSTYGAERVVVAAGITLTWSLDRAVVDERQASRAWTDAQRVRRELEAAVGDAYVERRQLLGELAMRDLGPLRSERTAQRVQELTALLDALTGGMYGGSLGERARGRRSER